MVWRQVRIRNSFEQISQQDHGNWEMPAGVTAVLMNLGARSKRWPCTARRRSERLVRKKEVKKHENGVLQLVPHIYSEQKLWIGLVARSMNYMNSSLTASFFSTGFLRCMEYKAIPTTTSYRWLDAGISPKAPWSWSYIYAGGWVVRDAMKQDKDTCVYIYVDSYEVSDDLMILVQYEHCWYC